MLYVFGDNLAQAGFGGQAREARGEPNAVGVPTKRHPARTQDAYFTDNDHARFTLAAQKAFHRINDHLLAGGTVVFPADGLGTGLAELEQRAPLIWTSLQFFIAGMDSVGKIVGGKEVEWSL